jgi:DNA-binding CsgD family transcriptional regulator
MARPARLPRVLHDALRLAGAAPDPWTLQRDALKLVRRGIPFDAAWWALADPDTLLFTHALADEIPSEAGSLFLENELFHGDVNRFTTLARSASPVATLFDVTGGHPDLSRRFRDILTPLRMGDELRIALRDRRHAWGFVCLHRERGAPPFSDDEQGCLRALGPHLAAGLRQAMLLATADIPGRTDAPGVLVVTSRLDRVSLSDQAEMWLAELHDWPALGARSVCISAVVARLLATERPADGVPSLPPRVCVQTRCGRWLRLSASRLGPAADHIVVVVAPADAGSLAPLLFAASGLTGREEAIARCALRGLSNKEAASVLGVTPLTVQQHLKRVFEKTGVHSRGELVMRLQAMAGR